MGRSNRAESVGNSVTRALEGLMEDGYVRREDEGLYSLADLGIAALTDQASAAKALDEGFRRSLSARTAAVVSDPVRAEAVADVAHAFVSDCLDRRALGLALALDAWTVGVERGLPTYALTSEAGEMRLVCDPDRVFGPTPNGALVVRFIKDAAPDMVVVLAKCPLKQPGGYQVFSPVWPSISPSNAFPDFAAFALRSSSQPCLIAGTSI